MDVESDPRALMGRVEALPGGERREIATHDRGVLEGNNHGGGEE